MKLPEILMLSISINWPGKEKVSVSGDDTVDGVGPERLAVDV